MQCLSMSHKHLFSLCQGSTSVFHLCLHSPPSGSPALWQVCRPCSRLCFNHTAFSTYLTSLLYFTHCVSPFLSCIFKTFTCSVYINSPCHSALPGSGANPERNTEVVNTLLTHNCTSLQLSESSEMCILLWHDCFTKPAAQMNFGLWGWIQYF